ncbi:MAG: TetR/AcrR family transcriptional regulator [Verrucomicrobiales bacterium]|nr:TetR/AcrR family transcriptional regulator [Verrucomicrobiales bacterium]
MGRTAEFERDLVLEQAMEVFWERGYYGSSIGDLKSAMGLNPGSIYAAFGSKEKLLLACLEHYSSMAQARFRDIERSSSSAKEAFLKIFDSIINQMDSEQTCRGCLIINTLLELASHEGAGGSAARQYLETNREIFSEILEDAKITGELKSSRPVDEIAAFLLGTVFSLRVMGKAKAEKETLESIRDQSLNQVFG